MQKTLMLSFATLLAGATLAATDGTYWNAEGNTTRKTGEPTYWLDRTIAGEGGTATFANSPAGQTLDNTIADWTLGGLALNGFTAKVTGEPISLTGDADVSGTGSPTFLCTLKAAESTATLTKRGSGMVTLGSPLAGFSRVTVLNGRLASQTAQGTAFADGPVSVVNGMLKWVPACSAGESADGTVGGESLKVAGNADVWIEPGKAASATLTLPPLDLTERNPVARILPTGGSETLGDTVKVFVSGTPPETANGCVDPRIVTRATDAGKSLSFLAYDAERGLVPAAANGSVTDADAATKIVRVSSDTALPANAKVGALVVEGKPAVTGTGVTVGDGVRPAGIIVNESTAGKTDLSGAGTIAFGDAPGVIWQGNKSSADDNIWSSGGGVVVLPPISGTKGVTFASAKDYGFCTFRPGADKSTAAQWSGPTRIAGPARFEHSSAACLPSGGDVFVEGGELYTVSNLTYPNQRFYFAGKCRSHGASYKTGGSPTVYFDGLVTLEDTMTVAHDNDGCLWFRNAVVGKGGIESVNNGRVAFAAPCSFEGGVLSGTSTRCIYVCGTGTLGTGPVVAQGNNAKYSDCSLQLKDNFGDDRAVIVHPNDFTVTGHGTELNNSCVAFPNRFSSTRTTFADRTRVGVGTQTDLGELDGTGGLDFYGVAERSVLSFAVSDDCALAFDTADGADGQALALTKKGTGTLTWSGRHTHSGATTVEDGTVRIEADPLKIPSLRYWLDASDDSTVTEDEGGRITAWRSKTGGLTFTPPKWGYGYNYQFYGPTRTESLNGRKVVSFRSDAANNVYTRLLGDKAVPNRHHFLVIRIRPNQAVNSGFFGAYTYDYGLRLSWNGGIECSPSGGQYPTRWMRTNGVECTGTAGIYTPDRYFLLEAFHDEYDGNASASKLTVFQPIIGGYFQWSPWRNAEFDLAEMLTFDTILTDAERVTVENYLQEKWAIPGLAKQDVPGSLGGLSAESDLVLGTAASTLDLNGFDATVKGLSGCGKIVNSSERPVTLKVTSGCSFRGTIAANVTLDLTAGGDAALAVANALPVRDGISFWVDASYRPEDYVVTNAEGRVTDWLCRAGTVERFTKVDAYRTPPHQWSATGLEGVKPAVYFDGVKGSYGDSLTATTACSIRTLFFVCRYVSSDGNSGFFGKSGADVGFRSGPSFRTGDGLTGYGDEILVNDTDYTGNVNATLSTTGPSILSVRCTCDRPNMIGQKFALGQYVGWNMGTKIWISEVIAYDRVLTDAEYVAVKQYLTEKWSVSTTLPKDVEGQPYELANLAIGPASATLRGNYAASGDWLFDFGGLERLASPLLTVTGTLSLDGANASFVNVGNLERDTRQVYLKAETLTGDFAATDFDARRYDRRQTATEQSITRFRPGTFLIIR